MIGGITLLQVPAPRESGVGWIVTCRFSSGFVEVSAERGGQVGVGDAWNHYRDRELPCDFYLRTLGAMIPSLPCPALGVLTRVLR